MWIRSQDEEVLINLDCISFIRHNKLYDNPENAGPIHILTAYADKGNECCEIELGRYFSGQRIMEILEEIEDEIMEDTCTVYYMPEK